MAIRLNKSFTFRAALKDERRGQAYVQTESCSVEVSSSGGSSCELARNLAGCVLTLKLFNPKAMAWRTGRRYWRPFVIRMTSSPT